MHNFIAAFQQSFTSILSIFFIGILGFYILRKGILGECCLKTLSDLVINITVPCLIFNTIVENLKPADLFKMWIFPVMALAMFLIALLIAWLYTLADKSIKENSGVFKALISIQNSLFLPLPIITLFFEGEQETLMLVALFLYSLINALLTYIFAPLLMAGREKEHISTFKLALNMPTLATIFSIIFVFLRLKQFIPYFIQYPIELVGNATVPLIMISLGGFVLVYFRKKPKINYSFIIKTIVFKLFVVPSVFLALILVLRPEESVGFMLIIQASMPPATVLPLIARVYGGNHELLSQCLIYNLIVTVISFPLFISIFKALL
ncbi:MAG: AEC family transporter [Candidatus Aureabacteria bacterium]|nr:AEC family transporter [Candidatus Auribacterota bacterium]